MEWIAEAFERRWFYVGALALGALYGFGGAVHVGNILGFGEMKWTESPVAWRFGDIWWGVLDIAAFVGIILKSPVGLVAIVLAAGSQVIAYGLLPDSFATTDAHGSTLRGLIYLNVVVLVAIGIALYSISRSDGT